MAKVVTLEQQMQLASRIDSFASNYSKTPTARFNLGYLASRSEGLQALWAEFVNNHDSLSTFPDDNAAVQEYFETAVFDKYEDIYFDISGRINEKKLELAPPPPPVAVAGSNAAPPVVPAAGGRQHSQPHHIQIPRLNVPVFNGDYDDWPSFRDLFVAAVHSNPSLLPVHKLQYLKSLLSGTAETLLKHVRTTADNYTVAWKLLEERFDNKRALINATLRKLFAQRPVEESPLGIRQILDSTRECIGALHIHGVDTESWDSILIFVVSQNVPTTTLDLWEQQIQRNQLPTIDQLLQFLEDRFRGLEFSAARNPTTTHRSRNKPQAFVASSSGCRLCQGPQHPLRLCPKFIEFSPAQRLSHVAKAKLCKNCFAFSHQTQACKSSGTCSTCGDRHHSLLHAATSSNRNGSSANPFNAPANNNNSSVQAAHTQPQSPRSNALVAQPENFSSDNAVLATALVAVKSFDGRSHTFRALLDNGSQENFISRRVLQFLGVKPNATAISISGVGQAQAPKPLGVVDFEFGARNDASFAMTINAIVLPVITHVLPARNVQVCHTLVDDLDLADPTYGTPSTIDILLSATVFASIMLPSIRKDAEAPTVALQTKLGWVLFGEATANSNSRHRTCFHITSEDRVSAALQEFWKVEEVPSASTLSKDDEKCEQFYGSTHTRTADGRYCVQLPFKDVPPMLGSSRDRAVTRFLQVERKLASNPKLREDYSKCINEYLELGHMHRVTSKEEEFRQQHHGSAIYGSYYLPHHAVIKEESTTTKLRVVFDASSKTTSGLSLNKSLLTGPVLQDSLFDLLIRWRVPRIVIKADIAKMYRQVRVADHHQPFQRIIWRNSPAEELQDYQLGTVTFGTSAAPYLAIKTLQQLGEDEAARYPIGAAMLKNEFYVDDLLSGADTINEAIEKRKQVTEILKSGGFDIRKWSSNDKRVTNELADEATEVFKDPEAELKALGIVWCPLRDTLSIQVSDLKPVVNSKRALLSQVSRLFDPLGWIAPTIISMKILLQKLWLAGLNWDEPLPPQVQFEWTQFLQQLPSIQTINIPRWLKTAPNTTVELHGFSDASEKAYAAAIYVRVKVSDTAWAVHLITSKTRVAPVKQLSLPRLELCGSVLMTNLLVAVQSSIKPTQVYAWTDSEIVLSWLQGHPNRWKTFVANRVASIHTSIDAGAWHHVPSKDNPADCASRGISPEQLVSHPIWWFGPAWLSKNNSQWPHKQKKDIAETQLEAKTIQHSFIAVNVNDTIDQVLLECSSLAKAENVIARIRHWHPRFNHQSTDITVAMKLHERDNMLRHIQQTNFSEYAQLEQNQPLHKGSKLRSLNPFIDGQQLIRVGGRLEHSDMPYDVRHPLIVPRKSRFTELLINEAHKQTLHGSVALIQTFLRTRYWVIDSRNTIRHIIHRCNTCFRFSNPSLTQIMGQLPKPRVNITTPFSHTGVDYAGPFAILLRRSPGRPIVSKGYICLFVCLATKAIHLELVGDMTATTFLAALTRFTGRRGSPSDIYSDNGTYFVKAATDITADMAKAVKENAAAAAKSDIHKGIQWHFIPPAAPHFGGLWEAGVKSTKYHLKRIANERNYTYEELSTVLCQIEGCLNSRPLCPISTDPDDFEILTPGHFLTGRPLCARPQPSTLSVPENRLNHWQRVYNATQKFWKLWQAEYLSRLQQRPKWTTPSPNIVVGELVLLKDDNSPPSHWSLARIAEVHHGADNQVRVVTLRTAASTFKRPISKICRLPTQ